MANERLVSLDAYRGATMLLMASHSFGLAYLLQNPTLAPNWVWLADQCEHRKWTGCTLWDLIQPSFMFIVGVAMPYAYAVRAGRGDSYFHQLAHAFKRSLMLVAVGIFLDSFFAGTLQVQFIRVLQQIAIGYLIASLVLPLGPKVQGITALFLLIGHTAAYLIFAKGDSAWTEPAVAQATNNFGTWLDSALRLPLSRGHYVTFNAISSAATILLGVLTGELLNSGLPTARKMLVLVGAGLAGIAIGWALAGGDMALPWQWNPMVPMIKRLWTASFAIYAAGWTALMMAFFYVTIEPISWKWWSFPFVVVGMNSIAMYCFSQLLYRPIAIPIADLFLPAKVRVDGQMRFPAGSPHFLPVIESLLALLVLWGLCLWLYRRKIFFKV